MAIKRIKIDYTVYPPNYHHGDGCWDLRNFERAKQRARGLGAGSRIYRNFNQTNKRDQILGDWWTGKHFWTWNGVSLHRKTDADRFTGSDGKEGKDGQ
jgi:hypothetical protein